MNETIDRERTARYYWDLVLRRHWLLAAVFAAVAALVFIVGARQRPLYRATATLLISQDGSGADPLAALGSGAGLAKRPLLVNHIEIIRSRVIARRVLDALSAGALEQLRNPAAGDATAQLQRALSVRPVREADIIALSILAPSPDLARELAEAYVAAYRQFNLDRSREDVSATRAFIGGQLEVVGARLDSAERRLEAYKQAHRIVDIGEETRATVARQTAALASLAQTRAEREGVEHERAWVVARIDSIGAGRAAAAALSPTTAALQAEVARLEAERAGLDLGGFDPAGVRMRLLGGRIDQLKARLGAEIGRLAREQPDPVGQVVALSARAAELAPALSRLRATEATLERSVGAHEDALELLPERERSLARLARDVDVDRRVHALLAQRYEEARILEAGRVSSVAVIDAPAPGVRVRPNHRNNAVAALLLGLLLAAAVTVGADYVDTTVRRPEDIERQGFSILASVPRIADAGVGSGPLALREPAAAAVEAFRVLRTSLQFAAAGDGATPRLTTLIVTSPGAGEGKSTVASNLAAVLAQSGKRTLLIDADLRKPKQHIIWGRRKKPGLTDVTLLGAELSTALFHADEAAPGDGAMPAQSAGLDMLFAGTTPPAPVDFLNSPALAEFLTRVAGEYDCVLFDTPPVLVSADSCVLAARVDGVVLVSRMGKTDWRALREARKLLAQAGARVFGAVANEITPRRGYGYNRYKYRYYHYRYGATAASQ